MDDSTFRGHSNPVKKEDAHNNFKDNEKQEEKSGIPKHFECNAAPGEALKKPILKQPFL
jgi:hypothetical protein